MPMPIYYTNSNSCYPNNAIVIGGVNTAAKRRIQRKSLHSCRQMGVKPTPIPSRLTLDELYKPLTPARPTLPPIQAPRPKPPPTPVRPTQARPTPARLTPARPTPARPTPAPSYNCLTKELWSDEKKDWCCRNQNLGCPA